MSIQNILFDLDGTLTDPKQGITKSIQYALKKLGKPRPAQKELLWCIGPPLLMSFEKLLEGSGVSAEKALACYRERYSQTGKFENRVYDDIPTVLGELNQMGLSVFVATSKPCVFAREIVDHFGLSKYFKGIYGSKLSGELTDKGELIAQIIKRENLSLPDTLMVGDRKHDIWGARKCNIRSLGVTYGYGSPDELRDAGADFLVDTAPDILSVVRTENA